jgi:hypothetical protein
MLPSLPSLLSLPEDVMHHVMLHLGPVPQDLLRLSRCCVRLHAAVVGAASVWRQLFTAAYPQQQQVQQHQQHADYRELYKQR